MKTKEDNIIVSKSIGWNYYVTLIISQKHKQKVCFPIVLR